MNLEKEEKLNDLKTKFNDQDEIIQKLKKCIN